MGRVTPKKPTMRKMPLPGHYRPPTVKLPGMGAYNAPTRGRVGKQMPQPRKPGSARRPM